MLGAGGGGDRTVHPHRVRRSHCEKLVCYLMKSGLFAQVEDAALAAYWIPAEKPWVRCRRLQRRAIAWGWAPGLPKPRLAPHPGCFIEVLKCGLTPGAPTPPPASSRINLLGPLPEGATRSCHGERDSDQWLPKPWRRIAVGQSLQRCFGGFSLLG